MTYALEMRDREILRTLLRVRFLTTREINAAFFACPRVGRRRLHKLSERDYIKPHAKGLPTRCPYSAWRLTTKGLDAVERSFPEEPIPDGLLERLGEQSLHNLEHREAISRLYLRLILGSEEPAAEGTPHAVTRKRMAHIQGRATQALWRPDGDVVLRYKMISRVHEVVPDATVSSCRRKTRVFIELDRSTKPLGRIGENLKRYADYLRSVYALEFTDGFSASVLYVVGSDARRQGVRKTAKQACPGGLALEVFRQSEAVEWLEKELLGSQDGEQPVAAAPSEYDELHFAARKTYTWAAKFVRVLAERGVTTRLQETDPGMVQQGTERLLALYDRLHRKSA